jgi:hypothetical protein
MLWSPAATMAINIDGGYCMYGMRLCQQCVYTFWSCNELGVWTSENCLGVTPILQQEAGGVIDPFPDQLQSAASSIAIVQLFSFIYLAISLVYPTPSNTRCEVNI